LISNVQSSKPNQSQSKKKKGKKKRAEEQFYAQQGKYSNDTHAKRTLKQERKQAGEK